MVGPGHAFPELISGLTALSRDVVLDCELVVPDRHGNSDFERLRRRNLLDRSTLIAHASATEPASWCASTC